MADIPLALTRALAGRYTVEREVGAGGMATVYVAQDLKHGRRVAIKVLRPEFAQAIGSERFLREIEIAASIAHPHVLPLHDSGEAEGLLYYVMPFIDGESLRDRLTSEGAPSVPDALRLFRQVVGALGAAHDRGVVHRDVKPENVLLTAGHGLVADFGVARALSEAPSGSRLTTMGVAMGTPQYMAPEQALGDPDTDHRADLFAAGAVAYEMLTGTPPFEAGNTRAVFTALLTHDPAPPHTLREAIPESISDLVMWCLNKEVEHRPQSAAEVLARLDRFVTPQAVSSVTPAHSPGRRRVAVSVGVAVLLLAILGGVRWNAQRSAERWAQQEAIPEVLRLLGSNQLSAAAHLAFQAEEVLGTDPVLEPLWPRLVSPFRITSEPTGADIWYRPYEGQGEWETLGQTPLVTERFPVGAYRFRIELTGYDPVEVVRSLIPANQVLELENAGFPYLSDPSYVIDTRLTPEGSSDDGTVLVSGGLYGSIPVLGFGPIAPHDIPEFRIDRTEVTNAAFREFVGAGGYEDRGLWAESFQRENQTISWEAAMASFIDETARNGPAGWILGEPPEGTETQPVGGVSWYEADAYCRWRGRSLPTLYHWARSALPSSDVWVPFNTALGRGSNFDGEGPAPVGTYPSLGISGAYDLAGNVREWVSTPTASGRFLVGGAWSDPIYWLHDAHAAPPWQREPTDGFRCATFADELPAPLRAGFTYPPQDLTRRGVISDDVFQARLDSHRYDRSRPLLATVDSTVELAWGATMQSVTIDAANGDRMVVRLHFPTDLEPPFQPVIFFGGGNMVRSSEMEDPQPPLPQLIRTGRVLVEPAYDGTFHRNDGRTMTRLLGEGQRQILSSWIQDLGRTIDYLTERPDVDHTQVAYLGISLGATLVPSLLPFEPRIRAAVLYSGGLPVMSPQPRLDATTALAARMRIPVLMLGGENDFHVPEDHQRALFEAFGAPESDKVLRIYESGHWPLPMGDVIRETVDFLDRHVGGAGAPTTATDGAGAGA